MYKKKFASFSVSERKFQCENQHADLAVRAGSQRGATLLSGHKEDLPGSLEVLVVLVGEQLVDMLLPVVIVGRNVFRGCHVPLLAAATAVIAARYNLVIL